MLATELIQKLQAAVAEHGDAPVFDWDNDEITAITFARAEELAYGGCPTALSDFPDRLILAQ